ncbi:MAG: N-6 DNA methylase [Candidatus Latescibacterota bacterium]|nr:MAG: N-6 DNA methylase [Candidatus Latescibacterota bacterium]
MDRRARVATDAQPRRALADLVKRYAHDPAALWSWIERLQDTQTATRTARVAPQLGVVQTPMPVAQRMAQRLLRGRRRGARLQILDPGCGAGRLLAAAAHAAEARAVQAACYGVELDASAARWAQALAPVVRAAAPHTLAAWEIRHADFLFDAHPKQRFDAVIANPPYVALRDLESGYRQKLRARGAFPARGDLALLFLLRMLELLRPKGRLCAIVPNKLLASEYAVGLRALLMTSTCVEEVWDLAHADVFEGRATYPVILVLSRRQPGPDHTIRILEHNGRVRARWPQRTILQLPQHVVPLALPSDAVPLLQRLLPGPRLGDVVPVACGIAKAGFSRAIDRGHDRIICSGDIRPFRVAARRRFAPEQAHVPRGSVRRQKVPKVIIPGMFQRLHAAWDGDGDLLGRVYYVPCARRDARRRALLLALLNSRLYAVLYRGLFGAVAQSGGYVRLNAPYLRCMPWPRRAPPAALLATVRRLERGAGAAARARLDRDVEALFALRPADRRLLERLESLLHGSRAERRRGDRSSSRQTGFRARVTPGPSRK